MNRHPAVIGFLPVLHPDATPSLQCDRISAGTPPQGSTAQGAPTLGQKPPSWRGGEGGGGKERGHPDSRLSEAPRGRGCWVSGRTGPAPPGAPSPRRARPARAVPAVPVSVPVGVIKCPSVEPVNRAGWSG